MLQKSCPPVYQPGVIGVQRYRVVPATPEYRYVDDCLLRVAPFQCDHQSRGVMWVRREFMSEIFQLYFAVHNNCS